MSVYEGRDSWCYSSGLSVIVSVGELGFLGHVSCEAILGME